MLTLFLCSPPTPEADSSEVFFIYNFIVLKFESEYRIYLF